jgi:hypothetical protein
MKLGNRACVGKTSVGALKIPFSFEPVPERLQATRVSE